MRRRYLGEDAQARFDEARFAAIRRIGEIAAEERCQCVVVCGDVFESNAVERRTVARAIEALSLVPVPVVLLPGNHDPINGASIWESEHFLERLPEHVHVLADTTPLVIGEDLEIVGAPWTTKRPDRDLCAALLAELPPVAATTRVALAHGAVDALSPDRDDAAAIRLEVAEAALAAGQIHYLALGDRHSCTSIGSSGRIHYAGAPEPTDFDEVDPGQVLVVDVDPRGIATQRRTVGTWRFERRREIPLSSVADLDAFESWLDEQPEKARTVLRVSYEGTLDLRGAARLASLLDRARDLFACVDVWEPECDLAVLPDDGDFESLSLSGFASRSVAQLRSHSDAHDATQAQTARDALALLVRLAGPAS